ncbi:hypothetical protein Are01nite_85570 [Actinoplanes regularis]|nr:hypothetical protein Are01nite_85570 [Actinoplanes regularis]
MWPCELAVAELVRKHGTGWRLAAYLCHLFEQVALLVPTADPLDLRLITIVRPLDAVEAWTRGPRVVEHWRAER